jgi:glutamine cyclotransferase
LDAGRLAGENAAMTSAKASALGADLAPAAAPSRAKGGFLLGLGGLLVAAAAVLYLRQRGETPWTQGYRVVRVYAHDPEAYTQGLVFGDGLLYESTGQRGFSDVRTVELESGKVLRRTDLGRQYFGEGLAQVGERLIQLTWQEGVARIYERATLKPLDQFEYEGEGWGLAFDGTHLVMSDGSETLVFRDPTTFKEVRRVRVLAKGQPLRMLNELEMVEGELWANVWKQDFLARIDPRTGEVLGFVDLSGIFERRSIPNEDAVLNGIAYDPRSKRLFVTGKLWPKLFEIEVVPK